MDNPTRSSGVHCAVFGCSNNHRKRKNQRQELCAVHQQTSCNCGVVKFHRFPKDPVLKGRWLSALNRKDFTPTEHTRVCSAHFVAGEKTDENIVPQLSLGYARKVVVGRRRLVRDASCEPLTTKRKKLSSGAGCGISSDSTAEHMIALASTSALAAPEHSSTSYTQVVEHVIALASTSEPATSEHTVHLIHT
ncbi:uncharacterized protein LOC120841720 [Ixodes scapularis]|uniref:uncharacterized protein LOC120841720 n=1 Tax=Ixodes scapularis TaxID=6945 RepID=UPI001A9E9247|nr:uncharacterized protein LOC120841720 [Ixodes scapularis]